MPVGGVALFLYHLALFETRSCLKYVLEYYHCPHSDHVRHESGSLQCAALALGGDGLGSGHHDPSQKAASTQGRLYSHGRSAS